MSLTVAFDAKNPPRALACASQYLRSLIAPGRPWVNWELSVSEPAPKKRRVERGIEGVDGAGDSISKLRPKTVTALAELLATECTATDPQEVLDYVARRLSWAAAPALCSVARHGLRQLPEVARQHALSTVAGLACELVLLREVCFIDPPTPLILCPETWYRYNKAVACEDPEFLGVWAGSSARLADLDQTEAEWMQTFSGRRWGDPIAVASVARVLARQRPPHLVLPAHLLGAPIRQQVQWAVNGYTDPNQPTIPERAWWILGALQQVVHCGTSRYLPLVLTCSEARWREATGDDVRADTFFSDAGERLRHLLYVLKTESVQDQVPLRTGQGFKGYADFVIDADKVLELKTSSKSWDVTWLIQAALYAHTLQLPEAHVFNVMNGRHEKIVFDENLFY